MAAGLAALLDDVAAIAKMAAASVDDVGAAAMKASVKATGVVVDDTAVTPRYVEGVSPDRELPIVKKIIEEHGGTLILTDADLFEGSDHRGALAEIRLPRAKAQSRAVKEKAAEPAVQAEVAAQAAGGGK